MEKPQTWLAVNVKKTHRTAKLQMCFFFMSIYLTSELEKLR